MSLINVSSKYYYFENNGSIITVDREQANNDMMHAVSIAISRLNDINNRFNQDIRWLYNNS